MKKIFVDVYLSFNFGDDLFLDILANKFPTCEFTVNYVGANYDTFLSRYDNVKRRKYTTLNKIFQNLKIKDTLTDYNSIAKEQDALVFIGGSIFREESFHQALYNDRMKMVQAFRDLNKPVYVIGANFGPVKTQAFVDDYRKFYELCEDVCFRDQASYEMFKEMSNVRLAPDVVFGLDVVSYQNNTPLKRVGFSIIDVNHKDGLSSYEQAYIEATIETIKKLSQEGYECWLLSFCANEGDLKVIEKIKVGLPDKLVNKIKVYDYQGDIEGLLTLMSTFDMCVAARFHANIISLLLNVGVMPVIYSSKTTNMLKDLSLDGLLIEMNDLSKMYEDKHLQDSFSNKLLNEEVQIEAGRQFEKLAEFIS